MAKHPTSSRVHREDHGPDDAFVSTIKRSYAWGRENARVVTIVLAVVVLAGVGALWFTSQQRQLESQATARFNQVQQTVASGNTQLAIRDLQTYLDRFGGTRAAAQARLLLGGILLDQDRGDEAIEALGDLPDDPDEPFGLAAARLKAAAFEATGNVDDAVDTYRRIADRARFPFERREALADAARLRLDNGEPDRAASLYEQVIATFDDDEEEDGGKAYYAVWLAEAQARADGGVAGGPEAADTAPAAETPDTGPEAENAG